MGASRHAEIERKYDVQESTIFPDLRAVDGVSSVGQPAELVLEAVYYDTAAHDLARHGVTLRRRVGGTDEGWHLKLPAGKDARTELREPLGREGEPVPESLEGLVRAMSRGRPLERVAAVTTRRREYPLHGAEDVLLAHVCDDSVHARALQTEREQSWREWEVELAAGSEELLDAVADLVLGAGATPSTSGSKLARALGKTLQARPRPAPENGSGSARELLVSLLAHYADRLQEHDAGVRSGRPEAVHRLRIAARRIRSALTTFGPLLDRGVTDPLRDDLRWLGQSLAPARDAQVLREHLSELLSAEPPELVMGSVAVRIDDNLSAAHQAGVEKATDALNSDRYLGLLRALDSLVAGLPMTSEGDEAAKKVLPQLLSRDLTRLRRAVRSIDAGGDPVARDGAIHEARKKAKRLRYAAEAATPALGKPASKLAASVKQMQEALGLHQDSVAARQRLREYAVQAHLDGDNPFTLGRLHALEQARAERSEADFARLWKAFSRKQASRWTH